MKKILNLIKVVVLIHLLSNIINGLWTATFICLFSLIILLISDFIQNKLKYNKLWYNKLEPPLSTGLGDLHRDAPVEGGG